MYDTRVHVLVQVDHRARPHKDALPLPVIDGAPKGRRGGPRERYRYAASLDCWREGIYSSTTHVRARSVVDAEHGTGLI